MTHLTYILYSPSLDKFYTGYTSSDLQSRLVKHLHRHGGFTARADDWVVVLTESFDDKSSAIKRERQIKNRKSKKRIQKLILEKSQEQQFS